MMDAGGNQSNGGGESSADTTVPKLAYPGMCSMCSIAPLWYLLHASDPIRYNKNTKKQLSVGVLDSYLTHAFFNPPPLRLQIHLVFRTMRRNGNR